MNILNKLLPNGAKYQTPSRAVIHSMAEYVLYDTKYIHAYDFLNKIGLSAHALVCPDGSIIRCREDSQGAWHARGHNKNSLGIEFLVEGQHDYVSFKKEIKEPYLTFDQYVAGVELVRDWCRKHDILIIDRHSDLDPNRKIDPGKGFDFDQFIIDVQAGV